MADDSFAVVSVQVSLLNDMVLGVHPVHAAASVVYGEAIGPEKMRVRNDAPVGSVHVGILDAWRVAPVGPVDLPVEGTSHSYSCDQGRRYYNEQKRLLFFTLYILIICSATQPHNELNVFSSLGFHPKPSSVTVAHDTRNKTPLCYNPFLELHRCLPVGTAVLPNVNPFSVQLGHVDGEYLYMNVCRLGTICSELKTFACLLGLIPFNRVQRDGSGFLHVLPQQHLAVSPVQVGDLNTRCSRVCPVELVMDPVNGQPT